MLSYAHFYLNSNLIGTLFLFEKDICLGGESKTPEGTVEILVEEVGLDGVTLEALNYYIINVSISHWAFFV